MPGYGLRERPFRTVRTREQPKPDAIANALTAQVIICVLALVCMIGMKSLNHERYAEIKDTYSAMLTEESRTEKAVEWFSNAGGVLSGIYDGIKSRITGEEPKQPEQPQMPGPDSEDEPEETPLPESGTVGEFTPLTPYNYLEETGGGYVAAANTVQGEMLPPPAGSTLSPVYLGAKIKPPVTGLVTSGFSYRLHPTTGESDFHTGLDIAAEEGRPILAALPGEVVEVGYNETYGNYIVLKHAINLMTSYSHCSKIIAEEGMAVRQGERIALVGETGVATGPHLHFSVIVEGEFTDPEWVLKDYLRLLE